MKIIITGATGSLGAMLTRHFSARGHEIIATGRMAVPPEKLLACAKYIAADITKPFELPDADVCIHTAALSDDKAGEKDLFLPNVTGTEHVVRAAFACKQFIHISSSSVYMPENQLITEEMAGKQNNAMLSPYGKSKLLSEEAFIKTVTQDSGIILRPRALYGPGDKLILPRMLKLVKNGKIFRPGTMQVDVSMTHYNNLAHAIECCFASPKKGVQVYNVADDKAYVLIEVLRKITGEIYGKTLSEKETPIWVLKLMALLKIGGMSPLLVRALTKNMVLDISRITSELGYRPVMGMDAALKGLGEWVKRIGGPDVIKAAGKELAWAV